MSFDLIKGQDKAVYSLKQAMASGKLFGGYLFSGPEGVGKKTAALDLAAALNCGVKNLDACGECPSCRKIKNRAHPDLHIIESADSDIKIEDIREMQRLIFLRAYEALTKVFIIDNAHRLTLEAANAILKVLEEPPPHSLIILVTDKPALLLKTVVSRCKQIRFCALDRDDLCGILSCDHGLEAGLAHFLAFFCEGRMGQALRLKDSQILRNKNDVIDRFIFAKKNLITSAAVSKDQMRGWLAILGSWFRDIYCLKAGLPLGELINIDRQDDLAASAGDYSYPRLAGIMDLISSVAAYLEQNVNLKLLFNNLESQLCKD